MSYSIGIDPNATAEDRSGDGRAAPVLTEILNNLILKPDLDLSAVEPLLAQTKAQLVKTLDNMDNMTTSAAPSFGSGTSSSSPYIDEISEKSMRLANMSGGEANVRPPFSLVGPPTDIYLNTEDPSILEICVPQWARAQKAWPSKDTQQPSQNTHASGRDTGTGNTGLTDRSLRIPQYLSNEFFTRSAENVKIIMKPLVQGILHCTKHEGSGSDSRVHDERVRYLAATLGTYIDDETTQAARVSFAASIEAAMNLVLITMPADQLFSNQSATHTGVLDFPDTPLAFRLIPSSIAYLKQHTFHTKPEVYQTDAGWPKTKLTATENGWHVEHWTSRLTIKKTEKDKPRDRSVDPCDECQLSKGIKGNSRRLAAPAAAGAASDKSSKPAPASATQKIHTERMAALTYQACQDMFLTLTDVTADMLRHIPTVGASANRNELEQRLGDLYRTATATELESGRGISTGLSNNATSQLREVFGSNAGYDTQEADVTMSDGKVVTVKVNIAPALGFFNSYWKPEGAYQLIGDRFVIDQPRVSRVTNSICKDCPDGHVLTGTSQSYAKCFGNRAAKFLAEVDSKMDHPDASTRADRLKKAYEFYVKQEYSPTYASEGETKVEGVFSFDSHGRATEPEEEIVSKEGESGLTVDFGQIHKRTSKYSWNAQCAQNTVDRELRPTLGEEGMIPPPLTEGEEQSINAQMTHWRTRSARGSSRHLQVPSGKPARRAKGKGKTQEIENMSGSSRAGSAGTASSVGLSTGTESSPTTSFKYTSTSKRRARRRQLAKEFTEMYQDK